MEQMTVEQAIELTINMLRGIMVPAEYAEQIGIPVQRSILNLKEVMVAFEASKQPKKDDTKVVEIGGTK